MVLLVFKMSFRNITYLFLLLPCNYHLFIIARKVKYEVTEENSEWTKENATDIKWMLLPDGRDGVQPAIVSGLHRSDDYTPAIDTVKFYLYTRENANQPEVRQMNSSCLPVFKYFKMKKKTKVLIHGFGDDVKDSYMVPLLKDAYLSRGDYNVLAVDWSELSAKPWYLTAMHNTIPVSKYVARFIDHMSTSTGTRMENFQLIGFSLGAHVAGLASKNIQSGKIKHITGLDPAYILYSSTGPDKRLDHSQAELVEVVHTSAGYVGYEKPIGHRDFYPNGGIWPQPGCIIDYAAVCSHQRAYYYYSEAVKNRKGFKAVRCNSYKHFIQNCTGENSEFLELGKISFDKKYNNGKYFFETNPESPFGQKNTDAEYSEELDNWIL